MLYTIAVILLILWLLGFVSGYTLQFWRYSKQFNETALVIVR